MDGESGERRLPRVRMPRAALDAIAGAVAGGVARVIVSPLDVIKIRFQVQLEPIRARAMNSRGVAVATARASKYTGLLQATKEIFREEGLLGFWRGTVPGLLLVMPYSAIQFVVIHKCKAALAGSSRPEDIRKLRPELSFGIGAVAGVAATIGSYPFDLLRTVLASQGEPKMYNSMLAACRGIVRQQGVGGLFSGISPTLAEIVPYSGLQIGLYDVFKHALLRMSPSHLNARLGSAAQHTAGGVSLLPHQAQHPQPPSGPCHSHQPQPQPQLEPLPKFLCGLAAGTVAKAVCHPMDVVKKRFQVAGLVRHPRYGASVDVHAYKGMIHALMRIGSEEGLAGLYKGLLPSLIKAAPAAAITFFMYEWVSKKLELLEGSKK